MLFFQHLWSFLIMTVKIKKSLEICNILSEYYKDILESYVSDFYIENHWHKLPNNWKEFLSKSNVHDVALLLDFSKTLNKVFPLSLLSLRTLIIQHSVSRNNIQCELKENNESFLKLFWKNVKEKKRHEITLLAQTCYKKAVETNCFYVVDIGSGLGHLSRMLSYGYGLKVCTLEGNSELVKLAYSLDEDFQKMLEKKSVSHKASQKNIHINKRIEINISVEEFLSIIKTAFSEIDFKFGIIGLHPCGNLGSTLLRLYKECQNAVFINISSCCYMKLSLPPSPYNGFPLSKYSIEKNISLSYLSCEIACHAIEMYSEKLQKGEYSNLKVHAYRAALETMLQTTNPQLRHCQLCGVKYEQNLTFKNYCERALKKYGILLEESTTEYEKIIEETWTQVVNFYSIRLLLAPLIESIILYDRLLYVAEFSKDFSLIPLFNCKLSARNHVISAAK